MKKLTKQQWIEIVIIALAVVIILAMIISSVLNGGTNVTQQGEQLATTSLKEPETNDAGEPVYPTDEQGNVAVPTNAQGQIIVTQAVNNNAGVQNGVDPEIKTEPLENGGNILDSDPFIQVEDYVLFINPDDNGSLYKIGGSAQDKIKVGTDVAVTSFVVKDGWVYYCGRGADELDSKLYKMKTDGTERTKLADDPYPYVYGVDNNWIYYAGRYNLTGPYSLCRISIDGSVKSLVTEDAVTGVSFSGENVYYKNIKDNIIYKVNANGTNKSAVTDVTVDAFTVMDDTLYYSANTERGIYRLSLSGESAPVRIEGFDMGATRMCSGGGWVYFSATSDGADGQGNFIYKMNATGGAYQQVAADEAVAYPSSLSVAGDNVYIIAGTYVDVYRVSVNGGTVEKIA